MKLIKEKYRKLKPTIGHLADEVVIAQAWKKTHRYIRAHNWYADTLALDVSALGLESNARRWKEILESGDISLEPLKLVPAPKSEKWIVDAENGWIPEPGNKRAEKLPIRPLAHLMIREQTWASALMLCLADAVETAQGDCSEPNYFKAQEKKVYSYGNRLLCEWDQQKKDAWFRWGNTETYRKFFTDYQGFLKRPVQIGREVAGNHSDLEHVYVVSLDLSKFYDRINRKMLVTRLKDISSKYYDGNVDDEFWEIAEKITEWQWSNESAQIADDLGIVLGEGLPQGLVSAGFFANAYLINFDRQTGGCIGKNIPGTSGVELHDYCRYVDDLRLVVSVDDGYDIDDLSSDINKWITSLLAKHAGDSLEINPDKTKITALSDLDNSGTLSARIAQIQEEISGPADRDTIDGVMGVLEGLLTLNTDGMPTDYKGKKDHDLVRLARFDHDVRPDTLKRFAANRLESSVRNKRKLVDSDPGSLSENIDNESELLAKKLIWAWMQDPSLALVLRKALEIYPSPELIEPVIDAIFKRCSFGDDSDDLVSSAMMNYLLADLFRCCTDFHSYFQRIEYPASSDPNAMLALAARYAQKAIACDGIPVFVEQQALLLLAVLRLPVMDKGANNTIHHGLHAILSSKPGAIKRQNLALYEVASQITGKPDMVASVLLDNMDVADPALWEGVLDELSKRGGEFWVSVWKRLKKQDGNKSIISKFQWAAPMVRREPKPVKQKLSRVISSDVNGFVHESAAIKLALALVDAFDGYIGEHSFSPDQIYVKQKQSPQVPWSDIWKPEVKIECGFVKNTPIDPRYTFPAWLIGGEEGVSKWECSRIMYSIGCILRSAIVGDIDFTSNQWKASDVVGYKGLRTNWYKRRMGMMHSPETIVGEFATVSGWTSELLMTSLQWPGFEASYLHNKELTAIEDVASYKKTLENRLNDLNSLYCTASNMPALITQVKRPKSDRRRGFRLVTVQQLLPRTEDFSLADAKLDSPSIRKRHRDHLARVCQITHKTLLATLQAGQSSDKSSADLIVLPEVAVHPDDEDIIKRLADKTRSMVLAGLTFQDRYGKLVNIARWYIPDYRDSGRIWIIRDQGKAFPTSIEIKYGVKGSRPCQHIIEVIGDEEGSFKLSGAICYDATDLKLASDLKDKTHLFVVVAHNKDVSTFDTMTSALHYHMYQHVVLVNKGEFGGSTIQAPYKESYERLISHAHGKDQISINVADLDLRAFVRNENKECKEVKTKPAG